MLEEATMPGPPPNPDARRRNAGSRFLTLAHNGPTEVPALPRASKMLKATRDAWHAWWTSPMASQWTEADVPAVALMAAVYDEGLRGDLKQAQEFRHWADRMGLSPLARMRNRWALPEAAADTAAHADATVIKLHAN